MTVSSFFFICTLVAMFAVLVSLFWGMVAMTKGKEKDHATSNKMMRARVLFQGLAIFFLFISYLTK